MADLEVRIDDLVVGDDYDIVRDITNIPVSQTISEAWLTVKEDFWDSSSIISKHITTLISGDGIIEDTGVGDTVGRIRFTLRADETIGFYDFFEYVYDIQVKTDAGKLYTPESGVLIPFAGVTTDT